MYDCRFTSDFNKSILNEKKNASKNDLGGSFSYNGSSSYYYVWIRYTRCFKLSQIENSNLIFIEK